MQIPWPIVPLSPAQLLDVRTDDLLEGGLYRHCDMYRGGGGYDKFPEICEKRIGVKAQHQFVVQLQKCILDCPYCYVTREGVWGKAQMRTTDQLVEAFIKSGHQVFHLMGGAPAIYLKQWPSLLDKLFEAMPNAIFTSDLLLVEGKYEKETLINLKFPRALYAVDIKGTTFEEWFNNTRKHPRWSLFWKNLKELQKNKLPIYFTFTNCSPENINYFWGYAEDFQDIDISQYSKDYYNIDLINYDALPYVDDHKWGLNND